MMKTVSISTRGLTAGSLFKLLFVGQVFSIGLLIVFLGILSCFGYDAVTFTLNKAQVTGVKALITSIVMAPIFVLVFSVSFWFFLTIGTWVYTRFATLNLSFKEDS